VESQTVRNTCESRKIEHKDKKVLGGSGIPVMKMKTKTNAPWEKTLMNDRLVWGAKCSPWVPRQHAILTLEKYCFM